jgi:hypothetical protein
VPGSAARAARAARTPALPGHLSGTTVFSRPPAPGRPDRH